jgi:hypothetical protein
MLLLEELKLLKRGLKMLKKILSLVTASILLPQL